MDIYALINEEIYIWIDRYRQINRSPIMFSMHEFLFPFRVTTDASPYSKLKVSGSRKFYVYHFRQEHPGNLKLVCAEDFS